MGGFFRGPSLITQVLIIGVVLAFLIPAISGVAGSARVGMGVGIAIGVAYWISSLVWGAGDGGRREVLVIVLIFVTLSAVAAPFVYDTDHRAYLQQSEERLLRQGDVVIYAKAECRDTINRYRLGEVWRNRTQQPLPWQSGEELVELREPCRNGLHDYNKVIFYQHQDHQLKRLGGFIVYDGTLSLKLDIGARNSMQRLLDWRVSSAALKSYIITHS